MDNFNHTQSQPFYNTIRLSEKDWKGENDKAICLNNIIENVFEGNPSMEISGWQMRDFLESRLNKKVNINSVRRSISNLKNDGVLEKTETMRTGNEGKKEHLYKLSEKEKKQVSYYQPNLL